MMYCVRAEGEEAMAGGRGVAVNSSVGSGVSVGGNGVNVGTYVAGSMGASESPAGWNGVRVGEALGLEVTNTSVGGALTEVGRVQAARRKQNANRKT
jgi:hypothetical protein